MACLQAQWSRPPASPFPNYPFPGQAQSRGLNSHPGEYGLMHQPFHMDYNTHHHHQSLDANTGPFLPGDIPAAPAVHFPDELSLGYSITAGNVPPNYVNLSPAMKGDKRDILNYGQVTMKCESNGNSFKYCNPNP